MEMLPRHRKAHFPRRRIHDLSRLQIGIDGFENPRIPPRCAADRDRSAARFFHKTLSRWSVHHVTIADDRDVYGRHHLRNHRPVSLSLIEVLPRPAMHGDRGSASFFDRACKLYAVLRVPRPSETHFHGDRHMDGLCHRLHDGLGQRDILHQRRAIAILDHLLHGAAHIDIDDVRPCLFHFLRTERHDLRIASEELQCDRMLSGIDLQHILGLFIFIIQALGTDHFRCRQCRSHAVGDDAIREITHARHRGEQRPAVQQDAADAWFLVHVDSPNNC